MTDNELIVKALWKNPSKYKRRLVVEEQGESHFRIKFDKSEEDVLNLIRAYFNLDENNKPVQSKVSTLFKYMKQIFSKKGKKYVK